jgi:hypothetical protein
VKRTPEKIVFSTQSNALVMFDALRAELAKRSDIGKCGFVVADSWFYQDWSARNPNFERAGHALVKEWEITDALGKPDLEKLARYEALLGPGLFGAIIADRRLIGGPNASVTQDYRRRYDDDALLSILLAGCEAVERLFNAVKPDLVLGFICVTMLDYLVWAFARARGVRYLNIRPTRIGNRVQLGSILNDPSPEMVATYTRILRNGSPLMGEARAHLARVRGGTGKYEGVVAPSAQPIQKMATRRNPLVAALRLIATHRRFQASVSAQDNHCPGILRPLLFKGFLNPLRARAVEKALRHRYVTPAALQGRRYAFLPLHTEPEVSLLVYQRPLVNQIEAVRAFAMSLPADMVLVVKEHPWMVGKRKLSTYEKMLAIPKVRLAPPESDARSWITGACLVTVLTSSVALEAAILGKPVVSLGYGPFNMLPDCMVRRAADLQKLPQTIAAALAEASSDERAIEAYVATVMELSVGVNLYTTLLGRSGAHADRSTDFTTDIGALADFVLRRAAMADPAPDEESAPW